jgi:hypothetical protein
VRFRSIAVAACAVTLACSGVGGFTATASAAPGNPIAGYWSVDSAGHVVQNGDARDLGDLSGVHLNAPVVGIAPSRSFGFGYWLAAADGGVFAFGEARYFGSAANLHLKAPIVGIASTGSGNGYWLVASDGGVFTYGDAKFFGSAGNLHLNAPIVGMAPARHGYRLVASDGGVFTFGGATFRGSAGSLRLNAPIVGIASTSNDGYRLAASDGGVFTYGASYSGRAVGYPTTAITTSPFGGYVLQSADGWLSAFGNASSCRTEAMTRGLPDPTQPRFVGVAPAFAASNADPEGGMATVHCPFIGGATGSFHAAGAWRVEVSSAESGCYTSVLGRDRVGNNPVPTNALIAKQGWIQMRRTQMAGHRVFDVAVTGTDCEVVATRSTFQILFAPFTTSEPGDTLSFSGPFTVQAHGKCTTEVRSDADGRLVKTTSGGSYTMHVGAGVYWVSNTSGCTISVTAG